MDEGEGMRWIPVEVFQAGESNPYSDDTAVVRRRMRAVPLNSRPWRTWVFDTSWESWARLRERRTGAIVGHAWIRRSALLWRRAAWALWAMLAVAAVLDVLVRGPGDERVVTDFGGELFALLAAAFVLIAYRVKAVVDPDDATVGIRG